MHKKNNFYTEYPVSYKTCLENIVIYPKLQKDSQAVYNISISHHQAVTNALKLVQKFHCSTMKCNTETEVDTVNWYLRKGYINYTVCLTL